MDAESQKRFLNNQIKEDKIMKRIVLCYNNNRLSETVRKLKGQPLTVVDGVEDLISEIEKSEVGMVLIDPYNLVTFLTGRRGVYDFTDEAKAKFITLFREYLHLVPHRFLYGDIYYSRRYTPIREFSVDDLKVFRGMIPDGFASDEDEWLLELLAQT
ncbi:MAG: hypothetical protein UX24_C0014G0017 [Candidatus Giovannonibacteria bacterium GW2011_GWB1_45_9b]|uniref:Uncharacterized protein n=7 Tax=Candidatus Giovannoniibacteriota TaxID=1752738 RepID=A0A1F5X005_9BACT|nr:MAG: hypothetical protein UW55_C0014G0014 [Candidatus Giovannonibacteria bacterium GW2011_GWA2_44_26]KKU16289.1 MAG: hypothetical protein UX24_C0014G0017 [Candidatus Giovannonibacteria bacterium GW2011_GWB1_45_9b]OGF73556.1 MAG: hypothetical protein A2W57_03375 [Candidatus Giovannonibacteria bacterium RIFCSPHIGHO2_02_43_16]OGF80901.1 MAG: hypothetical protein A2W48_01870 [Candidatus Giovannonibacteria bacterium RIFCSPHIGHO2_12_44_12]OGF85442.1 MAG: hypothetical protein A2Z63_02750 [Candidatu